MKLIASCNRTWWTRPPSVSQSHPSVQMLSSKSCSERSILRSTMERSRYRCPSISGVVAIKGLGCRMACDVSRRRAYAFGNLFPVYFGRSSISEPRPHFCISADSEFKQVSPPTPGYSIRDLSPDSAAPFKVPSRLRYVLVTISIGELEYERTRDRNSVTSKQHPFERLRKLQRYSAQSWFTEESRG